MRKKRFFVSILIPVRNEERSIIQTLQEITKKVKIPYEIIIINDCSVDSTKEKLEVYVAKSKKIILVNTKKNHSGFSNALKLGLERSSGSVIIPVMGDLCDDPNTINLMYKKMQMEDYDIICGSRYTKGGRKEGGPQFQGTLSKIICTFLSYLLQVPTTDTTNAFKMYKREILKKVKFNPQSGVELSMELCLQAHYLLGAKIVDIPTSWRGRMAGRSKFKMLQRAPRYLRICLWASLNSLRRTFRLPALKI